MRLAGTNLLASVLAGALWALFSGPMQAQEGSQCCESARMGFAADAPQLVSAADVQSWASAQLGRRLGLAPTDRLEVGREPRSLADHRIYTLTQTALGLPVAYRESRLLLDADRRPVRLLGAHTPFPEPPSPTPVLTQSQALDTARASDTFPAASKLVFWPDQSELRLSYELEGAFEGAGSAVFERLYVDARDGTILERLSLAPQAFDAAVYDFAAACRDRRIRRRMNLGRFVQVAMHAVNRHSRVLSSAPAAGDAERLFAMLREVYAFLKSTLNLDSFDDRGGRLQGFVGARFGPSMPIPQCVGNEFTALWHDGFQAAFLPTAALDYSEIVGHEFGHGVVQAGSGLIYRNQSGALNESLADALGVAFRAWLDNRAAGNDGLPERLPDRAWRIRTPSGPLRDLSAPGSIRVPDAGKPYPDHFDDYWYVRADEGGVHVNSSIMNHGFYLLAMGGQHRRLRSGPSVNGIGLLEALKVFGRAATDLLTPNSSFEAARYAFADVAEILHGRQSPEWVATHTAMDAVGIPGYWERPAAPLPLPEPTGDPEPADPPERSPVPPSDRDAEEDATSDHSDQTDNAETAPEPPPVPEPKPRRDTPPSRQEGKSPLPDREPTPAPDPQPIPRPPPEDSLEPPSGDVSTGSAHWSIILILIALVLLALVLFALARLRPGNRQGDADSVDVGGEQSVAQVPGASSAANRSGSLPPPGTVAGTLMPPDGSPAIALHRNLLTSREGLVLGRSSLLCHVEIRDPRVSRRHARLRLRDGEVWIEDLNSTSGTLVGGKAAKPFEPVRLGSGDLVHIADLPFRLELS